MIVVYLQGGLGNQLFQYAFGRYLSLRYQTELLIDPYWFGHPRPGETPRTLDIFDFNINARLADLQQQLKWRKLRSRYLGFVSWMMPLRLVRESGSCIDRVLLDVNDDSYLIGFWQSERYFSEIRDFLLTEIQPFSPLFADLLSLSNQIQSCQSVSVHVRRGDYVTSASANGFHGVCDLAYYKAAIKYMALHIDTPVFYVFTDDPDWAKNNLEIPYPVCFVSDLLSLCSWQDLWLLSRCNHHIIANSSFSWWGAWLSANPGKVVIAPRQWFASTPLPADLLPEAWVKL